MLDVTLTAKLHQQGYQYHKLRKAFSKFYRRNYEFVSNNDTGLKTPLLQDLSEPNFYVDLVYKLRKIVGEPEFSDQFSKIALCHKRIGYTIDVIKQTACLAVNPVTADHFVYLLNCTPVGRGSESVMTPT